MTTAGFAADAEIMDWLLDGDSAIRWQVMRDLIGEPAATWRRERQRVATEGWGARLLGHRDGNGRWTPRLYGQKWISTTYTMVLLRQLGLPPDDPRARESCRLFFDEGLWSDGGINVSRTHRRSETCVTGLVVGLLFWFTVTDPRRDRLVDYLLDEQMPDGGWNCQRHLGATHSSFHTTINVLDGLRDYATGSPHAEVLQAQARGREFLLAHRLYRSHRTGAVVDPKMLRLTFPHAGAMTSCAPWTTSAPPPHRTTGGWPTLSASCWPSGAATAAGRWRPRIPGRCGVERAVRAECEGVGSNGSATVSMGRSGPPRGQPSSRLFS